MRIRRPRVYDQIPRLNVMMQRTGVGVSASLQLRANAQTTGERSAETLTPPSPLVPAFWKSNAAPPPDPIFACNAAFARDPRPRKVNLTIGIYADGTGRVAPKLAAVEEAERVVLASAASRGAGGTSYLPMLGCGAFTAAARRLVLGQTEPTSALSFSLPGAAAADATSADARWTSAQTLAGTGALRLGFDLIRSASATRQVLVSNPTYVNHPLLLRHSGLRASSTAALTGTPLAASAAGRVGGVYRYAEQSPASGWTLNVDAMCDDLSRAPPGSVALLQTCGNNPTGLDPTPREWASIARAMRQRGVVPFFDTAYQGLVSGRCDVDAHPIAHFASLGFPRMFVAQSFSKSMGLYNQRVGALHVLSADATEAAATHARLNELVRCSYSNPPRFGAAVATAVLTTPSLRESWQCELAAMSARLTHVRERLVFWLNHSDAIAGKHYGQLLHPLRWASIAQQQGMFAFTGLSPAQVLRLQNEHGVYLLSNGRLCLTGLTDDNVESVAAAIAHVHSNSDSNPIDA